MKLGWLWCRLDGYHATDCMLPDSITDGDLLFESVPPEMRRCRRCGVLFDLAEQEARRLRARVYSM